jgi:hypothetical protein
VKGSQASNNVSYINIPLERNPPLDKMVTTSQFHREGLRGRVKVGGSEPLCCAKREVVPVMECAEPPTYSKRVQVVVGGAECPRCPK